MGEAKPDRFPPSCILLHWTLTTMHCSVDLGSLDHLNEADQLAAVVSASTSMRVGFGERQGRAVRRIGRLEDFAAKPAELIGRQCASAGGFTIHANRYIAMNDRRGLEKILACGARGSFANQRLSLADADDPEGELVYSLKSPWRDGTEAIVLSPAETIERLVALIPPPYAHQSRYFGVLASHSKWRRKIILKPEVKKGFVAAEVRKEPSESTIVA